MGESSSFNKKKVIFFKIKLLLNHYSLEQTKKKNRVNRERKCRRRFGEDG